MSDTRTNLRRYFAVILVMGLALVPTVLLYGANSAAYVASRKWVQTSTVVKDQIGQVERIEFYLRGGYIEQFDGQSRRARFVVLAHGERGSLKVRVEMEKKSDGEWRLLRFISL